MSSQLERLAAQVRDLAEPSDDLRQVIQVGLRAARHGIKAAGSGGREGRAIAGCFQLALTSLQAADQASAVFGLDARAFAAYLASGGPGHGTFRRDGHREAMRRTYKALALAAVATVPAIARGVLPEIAGKVAGLASEAVTPGSRETVEEIVAQSIEAVFEAVDEGVTPDYLRAVAEMMYANIRSTLGK